MVVRGLQGRVQLRPARDQLPLRRRAAHRRRALDLQERRQGDRRARRACRSRSWPSTTSARATRATSTSRSPTTQGPLFAPRPRAVRVLPGRSARVPARADAAARAATSTPTSASPPRASRRRRWPGATTTARARCGWSATGPSLRFENRAGGADLNPYLALSAIIAAGLHGVDQGLELEPAFEGNAYTRDRAAAPAGLAARRPRAVRRQRGRPRRVRRGGGRPLRQCRRRRARRRSTRRSPTGSATGGSSDCDGVGAGERWRARLSIEPRADTLTPPEAVFAPVRSQTAFEETVERLGTAIKLGLLAPGIALARRARAVRATGDRPLDAAPGADRARARAGTCSPRAGAAAGRSCPTRCRRPIRRRRRCSRSGARPATGAWRSSWAWRCSPPSARSARTSTRSTRWPRRSRTRSRTSPPTARPTSACTSGSPRPRARRGLVRAMTEAQGAMTDLISYIAHPPQVLASSNAQHRRLLAAVRERDAMRAARGDDRAPAGHRAHARGPAAGRLTGLRSGRPRPQGVGRLS